MKLNIPTILTLFRIVLIPVLVAAFFLPFDGARMLSAFIFALAAWSDWFDGYLARKLNMTSRFGAFLDPVADKLMVATALVLLLHDNQEFWFMVATMVIIGREIAISALREWMAEIGERAHVAVSWTGKVKTALQLLAITMLLFKQPIYDMPIYEAGLIILYISAALTLWSMIQYLVAAWPVLNEDDA